jgi:DNA-binding beta-propeller fold protein YncE
MMNGSEIENFTHYSFESSSNSLLIVNYGAHDVVRWVLGAASWTLVVGTAGLSGSTFMLLQSPFGITCDSVGNVYVADSGNNRIQFFFRWSIEWNNYCWNNRHSG